MRLFAFLSGAAFLSLAVFALCVVHLALKGVFLTLGFALIASCARLPTPQIVPEPWGRAERLFLIPLFLLGLIYFVNALAPEVSPDGSAYHVAFVTRYYHWHGFRPILTNLYANMPQGIEMLFLFAFAFGRHSAAALVHLSFLFALSLLVWSFGRRLGYPIGGAAACAIVFLSPIFGVDASSAYNDVALAAIGFGTFYALDVWRVSRSRGMLILAGILAGFACSIKYTGIFVLLYAVAVVLISRPRATLGKRLAAVAVPAILLISPWLAKNVIVTGNPFSPFFNSAFPNRATHISFEEDYSRSMRQIGFNEPGSLPLHLTLDGAPGGTLGPAFLLAPLALLSFRNRSGRRLLFAAGVFALTFPFNTGTRFLMLCAPLLALAIAMSIQSAWLLSIVIAVQAAFAWPSFLNQVKAPSCWSLTEIPVEAALRWEGEETFLRRRMPHYDMARFIEKTVPESQRVLALDPVAEAYTTKTVLVSYESAESELERDILRSAVVPSFRPDQVIRFTLPVRSVDSVRINGTGSSKSDVWSMNEIALAQSGKPLPLSANWTADASATPWDARLATDGNLATRWSSWRGVRPGLWFSLRSKRPQLLDEVTVHGTSGFQSGVRLSLDLSLNGGPVGHFENPQVLVSNDPNELRAAATRALRERGTEFLMVPDQNALASEFLHNRESWNVSLLGHWGNARLYHLDDEAFSRHRWRPVQHHRADR